MTDGFVLVFVVIVHPPVAWLSTLHFKLSLNLSHRFLSYCLMKIIIILFAGLILFSLSFCHRSSVQERTAKPEVVLEGVIGSPMSAMMQDNIMTRDPVTGEIPYQELWNAYQYAESLRNSDGVSPSDMVWEERGPSNVGGRTRTLMFDPNDPTHKKLWAGAVTGGLWYTNDITASPPVWHKVDDFWERLPIGCMAYDPTSTNTFYVGTGEGWHGGTWMQGVGIYKSTDGGVTWDTITSTFLKDGFEHVQDIAVHPATGHVYAATRGNGNSPGGGILRSTDDGVTWQVVLNQSTAPTASPSNVGADIEIASDNYIYVTMGIGHTGGIFRSTTGNPGDWTQITTGIDIGATRRIELAVAPSASATLYCIAEDTIENSSDAQGMYKSTNRGNTWTAITIPIRTDNSNSFIKGQACYDMILAVHPTDPNTVFAGGVKMFRSINGGTTWTHMKGIHDDHHMIVSRPGFNNELAFGNDGGVYYTSDCTVSPPVLLNKNNGYNVTQFYTVAYHPSPSGCFLGGTQDNGTQRFDFPGINATTEANNGDGAYCYISQNNPRYQITARQWNNYYRSRDYGASTEHISSGEPGAWLIPAAVYDEVSDVLYSSHNGDSLMRIRNVMNSFSVEYIDTLNMGGTPSTVRLHPFASNLVILGTRHGRIFQLENANSDEWILMEWNTAALPDGSVASIEFGPSHSQRLVVFSNYNIPSVWETLDGGSTWSSKEGNLPNIPIRCGIYNPYDYKQVLVATEIGVWTTEDITVANPVWVPCNGGLANVRVDKLALRSSDMTVYAATHGRGIYTSTSLCAIPFQKLTASDGSNSSRLGHDLDIFGNYAIAGAPGDNQSRGAAYIFKFNGNTWEQSAKLTALKALIGDFFGCAVATDGNIAVIGAEFDDDKKDDAGAVYIFRRTGDSWNEETKLTASDGAEDDHFGCSVSMGTDYLAIGSVDDDPIGSVYIFKWSGTSWTQTAKIVPDPGDVVGFGSSVALYKDTLLVGSPGGPPEYNGKISVYARNVENWDLIHEVEGDYDEALGTDVALLDNQFIAGAYRYSSEPAVNSGGVFVFKKNQGGWTTYHPLYPPDCRPFDQVGASVDIYGDYIIAGSPGESYVGGATIYRKIDNHWNFFMRIYHSDMEPGDMFGYSVGLSSQYAMVGNPFDDNENGTYAGSVYFFRNYAGGTLQPDLSVVPSTRNAGYSASSATFNVYNLGTGIMDWTAVANDPWLTITGGASGTDDGMIRVSFVTNTYCQRTGAITVASPGALNSPKILQITQTASGTEEEVKIVPSDLQTDDYFGTSVAIDGNYAVIGNYGDDDKGLQAGSAYIYEYNGIAWVQKAKLTAGDAAAGDNFGADVAISGDYALVGAWNKNGGKGAAYIFIKPISGWQSTSSNIKLTASDGTAGDSLGREVAISGDYVILSAPGNGQGKGAVYFYDRPFSGWVSAIETDKLIGYDAVAGDNFGSDVAIQGAYAVVGSAKDDGKGSVYLYRRTWVWTEMTKLTASDRANGDGFGCSVDMWGDNIIAGASSKDGNKGAAYVFIRPETGWTGMTETWKLVANDRENGDFFGISVGVHDHNALVGAFGDDDNGALSGSAYGFIFNDTTAWMEEKLLASDGLAGDYYGQSVDLTYQYSIIGAPRRDDNGSNSGAAYIYCNSCASVCTPEMALTPAGPVNVPEASGIDTIQIENEGNCVMNWRCTTTASWLSVVNDTSGSNSGSVIVSWEANPGNARTASLICWSNDAFNAPIEVVYNQAHGPDIILESDSLHGGENICWFAANTVTVPQSGGYYIIDSLAEANILAGSKVTLLPGFHSRLGSLTHIYISDTSCEGLTEIPGPLGDPGISREENTLPEKTPSSGGIRIYPNPADDHITLAFPADLQGSEVTIELYSINGVLMKKERIKIFNSVQIDLTQFPAGMYFSRIQKDHQFLHSQKVIVRH
jgi:hypothetical protein